MAVSDKFGWLMETPTALDSGGSWSTTNMMGVEVTGWTNINSLANLFASATFKDDLAFLFTSPHEWVSRIMYYPFDIPSPDKDKYLKIGPIDTGSLKDPDLQVKCCKPLFTGKNDMINLAIIDYFAKPDYIANVSFIDHNGYTKIQLYLPYLGFVDVSPNDVIGNYIYVDLYVDYLTGQGIYYITVNTLKDAAYPDRRIISKHIVQLGYEIPVGSTNAASTARNLLMGAVKATVGVASLASLATPSQSYKTATASMPLKQASKGIDAGNVALATSTINASIGALQTMDLTPQSDAPNNSLLDMAGSKAVWLVIKRPKAIFPSSKNYGKPCAYNALLSTLKGFTKVGEVHLQGFDTATSGEIDEIKALLLSGVIL